MVAPGQLRRGTLPTIGRVEGKQDQVRLPAWIGVWDKGCRMEQPQPQRGAAFSWLFSRRSSRQLSVTLPERRYGLTAQLLASINDATAALIPGRWTEGSGIQHDTTPSRCGFEAGTESDLFE
jgi:hypothetical protein